MRTKTKPAPEPTTAGRRTPASIRFSPELYDRAQATAEAAGYSLNSFVIEAVEGCIQMIDAPEGQVVAPKVVCVARLLKTMTPIKVKVHK